MFGHSLSIALSVNFSSEIQSKPKWFTVKRKKTAVLNKSNSNSAFRKVSYEIPFKLILRKRFKKFLFIMLILDSE